MLPEVTALGPLTPYALIHVGTFVVAVLVAVRLNRRQGIPTRVTVFAALLCGLVSPFASRLLDVVEYWHEGVPFAEALARNGSSIYGGLLGSFIAVWLYTVAAGVSPLRFLDGGAPVLALSEALTRLGCFAAGCCYGIPWNGPGAVVFPRDSFAYQDQVARGLLAAGAPHALAVHPVQLYSFAVMTAVFVLLLRRFPHKRHDGELFFLFLVAYGLLRLLVAPLRMEALGTMKLFSLGFIAIGTVGLAAGRRGLPVLVPAPTRMPLGG